MVPRPQQEVPQIGRSQYCDTQLALILRYIQKHHYLANIKLGYVLFHITSDQKKKILFLCFHIFFNSSSSLINLIWINIDIMDNEKAHLNFSFHIHVDG
jgi:hypothetical protein